MQELQVELLSLDLHCSGSAWPAYIVRLVAVVESCNELLAPVTEIESPADLDCENKNNNNILKYFFITITPTDFCDKITLGLWHH